MISIRAAVSAQMPPARMELFCTGTFNKFAGKNGFLRHFLAVQNTDTGFYQLGAESFQVIVDG